MIQMRCPYDEIRNYSYQSFNRVEESNIVELKEIVQSLTKTGDFSVDRTILYLEGFAFYAIFPLGFATLSALFWFVFMGLLCCKCNLNKCNKKCCRPFSFFLMYLLAIAIIAVTVTANPTANAALKSSCAFDDSRILGYNLFDKLSVSITAVEEKLQPIIETINDIVEQPKPSQTLLEYTEAMQNIATYEAQPCLSTCDGPLGTYPCSPKECLPGGKYFCLICEGMSTGDIGIDDFIQNITDTVTPPVIENEAYLKLAEDSIDMGDTAIRDLLTLIQELRDSTVSEESLTGTFFLQLIEYSTLYNKNSSVIIAVFLFLFISFLFSLSVSNTLQYKRMGVVASCTCLSIVLMLCFVGVAFPFLLISSDLCLVLEDIPSNISSYYAIDSDVQVVVERCFSNGSLPQRYINELNFADDLDKPPLDTVQTVLDTFDQKPWTVYFPNVEGATDDDPVLQQRIYDIRNISSLFETMKDKETVLKYQISFTFTSIQSLYVMVKPTMFEIKGIVSSFSCADISLLYDKGVDAICGDLKISLTNFTILMLCVAMVSILYFFSMCGYLLSESEYRRLLNRLDRYV